MLGLKYGSVRLVEHDARWIEPFPGERALLLEALDGLSCAVEHIGSTAVPSLPVSSVATSSYAPSATFAAIRHDRKSYTKAKDELVDRLLRPANA